MDIVIYKNENFEIRSWDVLKLKDGTHVGVYGIMYQKSGVGEDEPIVCVTTPISSITSKIYPEHVESVIEHCGCFENQMDWWFKTGSHINQKLYINLDRNSK